MVPVQLSWITAGFLLVAGCAAPRQGPVDLAGKPVDIFAGSTPSVKVLIFTSNDCPIANRYAPEIRRLHERFSQKGVAFWLVHADPSESASDIREHARLYDLNVPEIRDPQHSLVRLAQAEVTPSAAVFSPGKKLVYHGRIDNRFVELGRERPEATEHDLADAIEAAVNGRPVTVPVTRAVGCYIPSGK